MITVVVFVALLLVLLLYVFGTYNGLVSLRENVKVAWSNIDVLLKQRHDELPKLVDTCKRYMQFEQETLEKVMRARASVSAAGAHHVAGRIHRRPARAVQRAGQSQQHPGPSLPGRAGRRLVRLQDRAHAAVRRRREARRRRRRVVPRLN